MSLALRIFIVLVLLMTMAFMFIEMERYALFENWKRRWDGDTKFLAGQLKESTRATASESTRAVRAENQVVLLQKSITDEQAKEKELMGRITELSDRIQILEGDLSKGKTSYEALNENYRAQNTSLAVANKRNAELNSIAAVARAVAFNLNVKLAEVEGDRNALQSEFTKRMEDLNAKVEELKLAQALIAQFREKFPKEFGLVNGETGSTEPLHAVVTEVKIPGGSAKQEYLTLSIGLEEGVKEGQVFIIYRENKYICRARVERVMNDMSLARIIPDSWNSNDLKVEKSDQAANRL